MAQSLKTKYKLSRARLQVAKEMDERFCRLQPGDQGRFLKAANQLKLVR